MQKKADEIQTFGHHLKELRRRLIWVVVFLSIGIIFGVIFNTQLTRIIQAPLGQNLYFTSPMGGLGFSMQICLLIGLIFAIPVAIYHILKFIHPASERILPKRTAIILLASIILASVGLAFAYFISLPSALKFLTHFGNNSVQALITTDEYMSFILTYLGGSALIFQLPLLLLLINRIKPLGPSQLKKYQPHVIVGCFIIAAILTPTPDPINQMIIALPMLVLFELSCVLVLVVNYQSQARLKRSFKRAKVAPVLNITSHTPSVPLTTKNNNMPQHTVSLSVDSAYYKKSATSSQLASVLDLSRIDIEEDQDKSLAPSVYMIDLRA